MVNEQWTGKNTEVVVAQFKVLPRNFPEVSEKTTKTSVRTVDLRAEIWTQDMPNTSSIANRSAKAFGGTVIKSIQLRII
jgi:hypothetical protein